MFSCCKNVHKTLNSGTARLSVFVSLGALGDALLNSRIMALAKRMMSRIASSNAHLMVCDVQERFRPLIHQMDAVINRTLLMSKGCNALDIPCIVTEHYPKIFQATVPEITMFPDTKVFDKKLFSMLTPDVTAALQGSGRTHVSIIFITVSHCIMNINLCPSTYDVCCIRLLCVA